MRVEESRLHIVIQEAVLYRVLRTDESPHIEGIIAKDPYAHCDLEDHVASGSKRGHRSQFITFTTDFKAAIVYGKRNITNRKNIKAIRVVVVDQNQLQRDYNLSIKDVSTGVGLNTRRAKNFAKMAKEVVVEGFIQPEYVIAELRVTPCDWGILDIISIYERPSWAVTMADPVIRISRRKPHNQPTNYSTWGNGHRQGNGGKEILALLGIMLFALVVCGSSNSGTVALTGGLIFALIVFICLN
ncbi:uncharacterized protein LOC128209437 [Mya arenaria]|uniref:uncharacterized protein LOC128209437 n=1 Tax=Mya arenaria TaxID=6604 RepID=UPI0022E8874C|nr:uncharacterized protein LOC128209437 [Mya arenaria]